MINSKQQDKSTLKLHGNIWTIIAAPNRVGVTGKLFSEAGIFSEYLRPRSGCELGLFKEVIPADLTAPL